MNVHIEIVLSQFTPFNGDDESQHIQNISICSFCHINLFDLDS